MKQFPTTYLNTLPASPVPPQSVESEESARRHALALQHAGVVTWEWDLQSDLVEIDDGFHELFALPPGSIVTGQAVLSRLHAQDLARVQEALENCFSGATPRYDTRFRVPLPDGSWRWLRALGQVLARDENGEVTRVVGINFDMTDTVLAEERLAAIAGEMRHRVKNSLAMVNALAGATARETSSMDDFLKHFRGRVDAIAAAQRMSDHQSATARLTSDVAIEGGLTPFMSTSEWRHRIDLSGIESVDLPFSLGQAITLAVYEFATNAVKYGALSASGGQISIRFTETDGCFSMTWIEEFEKELESEIEDKGFGSTLIQRLVRAERGEFHRELSPDRLLMKLRFPSSPVR